jgi:hypothetical protein
MFAATSTTDFWDIINVILSGIILLIIILRRV